MILGPALCEVILLPADAQALHKLGPNPSTPN